MKRQKFIKKVFTRGIINDEDVNLEFKTIYKSKYKSEDGVMVI